jgi:glycosyltransferase involved in cell wall biosynthesis
MTSRSASHVVIIPTYNTGAKLLETVRDARRAWDPIWVVVDGSTDHSAEALIRLAEEDSGLRVLSLAQNRGKGAAVLHGMREARRQGFTHALTMDADGQHPTECIAGFMAASAAAPDAMILGRPVFDASAPRLRVRGRRISNSWVTLETLGGGIEDSLCGFRVYPITPLCAVMESTCWMRRFDFDPEAVVRLCWRGVLPINLPAPIRYLRPEEGGVSHFDYVRDNALLTWMHARLMMGFFRRLPLLLMRRLARRSFHRDR